MKLTIESISDVTREEFYKLALEYLPYSDYEIVKKREAEYHQAYMVALLEKKVIGVAFGWSRKLGCPSISLGSAGGYVEHYYIKNGYEPICYKVYREQGIVVEKEYTSIEDYETYQRKNEDGFVVMTKRIL